MFNPFEKRNEEEKSFEASLKTIKDPQEQLEVCDQYLAYLNDIKEGLTIDYNIEKERLSVSEDDQEALQRLNDLDKKIKRCNKKIQEVSKKQEEIQKRSTITIHM